MSCTGTANALCACTCRALQHLRCAASRWWCPSEDGLCIHPCGLRPQHEPVVPRCTAPSRARAGHCHAQRGEATDGVSQVGSAVRPATCCAVAQHPLQGTALPVHHHRWARTSRCQTAMRSKAGQHGSALPSPCTRSDDLVGRAVSGQPEAVARPGWLALPSCHRRPFGHGWCNQTASRCRGHVRTGHWQASSGAVQRGVATCSSTDPQVQRLCPGSASARRGWVGTAQTHCVSLVDIREVAPSQDVVRLALPWLPAPPVHGTEVPTSGATDARSATWAPDVRWQGLLHSTATTWCDTS